MKLIYFRKILPILIMLAMAAPVPLLAEQNSNQNQSKTEATENPSSVETDGEALPATQKPDKKKPKDPHRGRFLPIPIFITEPAIGEGLGLALAYFHRQKNQAPIATVASPASLGDASKEQAAPPTVTGVFAAYTSSKTAATGIGHMNSFKNDHIRFTGMLGLADVNSIFYLLDHPLKFNLKGSLVFQETRFRFADSRWFWGIGLSYLDASSAFQAELPEEVPDDLFRSELKNVGLAAELAWDTRDNTSMPNRGQLFDLGMWRYDGSFGGDFDYWNTKLKLLSFHPLNAKFVLGLRFEYSTINGRAPFFAIPWVSLRGIAALRYQGERVAVAEIEGRYNILPRWALIGFTGAGWVSSHIPAIHTDQNIRSYGVGGRFKIFEAQNIWIGVDIARGPEETNWYIQIGQTW